MNEPICMCYLNRRIRTNVTKRLKTPINILCRAAFFFFNFKLI